MSSIRFKPFELSDIDACVEILESNIPEFFRPHEVPMLRSYLEKNAIGQYWCVYDGSRRVGCGGVYVGDDGRARFCWGMIHRDDHKRGYGRALAEFRLQELLKNPKVISIGLDTSQHNPEFFAKFGFQPVSVEKDKYAPGLDCHEMILILKKD